MALFSFGFQLFYAKIATQLGKVNIVIVYAIKLMKKQKKR